MPGFLEGEIGFTLIALISSLFSQVWIGDRFKRAPPLAIILETSVSLTASNGLEINLKFCKLGIHGSSQTRMLPFETFHHNPILSISLPLMTLIHAQEPMEEARVVGKSKSRKYIPFIIWAYRVFPWFKSHEHCFITKARFCHSTFLIPNQPSNFGMNNFLFVKPIHFLFLHQVVPTRIESS